MQSAYTTGNGLELLTPDEMAQADRGAIAAGRDDGYGLMQNAGASVLRELLARYPQSTRFDVLAGPGNNGGDGYVVARLLAEAGAAVRLYAEGAPRAGSDAAMAAADCPVERRPLADFAPTRDAVVVDALYGAGLSRALEGAAANAAAACNAAGATVVAVDLPSGVSGETGRAPGEAFAAALTVTFFRLKPGHLLEPGRRLCGETIVADIGIHAAVLDDIRSRLFRNAPGLWRAALPRSSRDQHKYSRGHVAVFSGGPASTGAARLSAIAAARSGAGAVTVFSPANAMIVNAAHLTSIMLRKVDDAGDFGEAVAARRPDAYVLGPAFGLHRPVRDMVNAVLGTPNAGTLVLDADGITAFRDEPEALFAAVRQSALSLVLTPHEGEFARLFADIAGDASLSKVEKARVAAALSHGVVVYKGPDTVIAAPDGRAAINANGVPWLATAGSGDVLAGIIAGLAGQGMPAFEAACAGVWLHAEAASRFGRGLIAEDLPLAMVPVLAGLFDAAEGGEALR